MLDLSQYMSSNLEFNGFLQGLLEGKLGFLEPSWRLFVGLFLYT